VSGPAPAARRVAAGGLALHVELYEARPPGVATEVRAPVVLLHGFTGSAATWSDLAPQVAEAGHPVIAVDLVGHGRSEAPRDIERYAMERACDDLAALLAALGHERAFWLGYSLGGRTALSLAARHPERVVALLLEGATAGIADDAERAERVLADDGLAERIERDGVPAFVDAWEALPLWASQGSLSAETRSRLRAQRLANDSTGLANSLRGMGAGAQPSLWGQLGELRAPTLLLAGSLDVKFTAIAGEMAHAFPDATMVPIEGAGHAAHLERPQLFAAAALRFLEGVRADAPRAAGATGAR
jgi:2-succinyl-6-hydroxy-2,4-cyclohexadiene-1-carboxylate synthase